MKPHLLYPDRDFDLQSPPPRHAEALTRDLALTTLFDAMAQGDRFVFDVAEKVILAGFGNDLETMRYRQDVLRDCLGRPAAVRELYALAVEAMELAKKQYLGFVSRFPGSVLWRSIDHLKPFVAMLRRLRTFADSHAGSFTSEGFTVLCERLIRELDDEYLGKVEHHLEQLRLRRGVLLSAELGKGAKGHRYVFHPPPSQGGTWLERLRLWLASFSERRPPAYGFSVHPRDESGARALAELRSRGIGLAAAALAQSRDHVRDFFRALRAELAFYIGCLNLQERLAAKGELLCLPEPAASADGRLAFRGLYDVCLSLNTDRRVVGNDADADRKGLVMVTGANQGGKSTFLRSIGLAQLMMQCGMFVPAGSFRSSLTDGLFTHYRREEDTGLESGKLDEELRRMSDIVDHLTPHSMVLLNESFAATNEREGSEIARQVLSAFRQRGIRVLFVTHLYELARGFHDGNTGDVLFLRAERKEDGARTFRLIEGEPLPTSFGEDLYRSVFGEEGPRGDSRVL